MGVYRTICYKVEDAFVGLLTKGKEPDKVKEKVNAFRRTKEAERLKKKEMKFEKAAEQQRKVEREKEIRAREAAEAHKIRQEKEEQEKTEIENLVWKVVTMTPYSSYEFNEVKRNKAFYQRVVSKVFEPNEYGMCFLRCEFDKSSKREIKGCLFATNIRVWFVSDDLSHVEKFRYQTIRDVQWFKDGILERGLLIQYGTKRLEFDEIFDGNQMKRFGDLILRRIS
ncbi:hypothetical protein AB1K84_24810 [Mesobacillus foraminis]|uniref:hypothetical protein n=1 Tax=Mesobacillus foraminis TaxID=279826 RepID=UPI0039A0D617